MPKSRRRRIAPWVLVACGLWPGCSTPPEAPRPTTDLFLVEIRGEGEALSLGPPVNLTRREGYDNQPCFLPGGEGLLYVSRDERGTDIYTLDLAGGGSTRLTRTRLEREYSPAPIPGADGLSVVRVERDGAFRLLRLDRNGGNATPVTDLVHESIGYYAWIDATGVAAIVVEEERSELQVVDMDRGRIRSVANNVGRSIQKVPGRRAVSYIREPAQGDPRIEIFDAASGEVERIGPTLPGSRDHAWLTEERLLMGRGSELFTRRAEPDAAWERLADLAAAGLREISRIAVGPHRRKIVVVAEPVDEKGALP